MARRRVSDKATARLLDAESQMAGQASAVRLPPLYDQLQRPDSRSDTDTENADNADTDVHTEADVTTDGPADTDADSAGQPVDGAEEVSDAADTPAADTALVSGSAAQPVSAPPAAHHDAPPTRAAPSTRSTSTIRPPAPVAQPPAGDGQAPRPADSQPMSAPAAARPAPGRDTHRISARVTAELFNTLARAVWEDRGSGGRNATQKRIILAALEQLPDDLDQIDACVERARQHLDSPRVPHHLQPFVPPQVHDRLLALQRQFHLERQRYDLAMRHLIVAALVEYLQPPDPAP